ncbi:MAG: transketolase [Spirochaetes bacterium RBG_16_67_19]|nr:MAG: transketolase [Spirochaetes bacterium RBG_16_67_19]
MRSLFNKVLLDIAEKNDRIYMVLADIGYGEIEGFAERFPDRFFNVGVAEQNMTGVACGVAMEGNIAVTYSIANFPTLRCLEQIRNDVCYHKANVKIVIIGGGLAYGALGVSHQATEDLAIMRALPDMVVLAPADFAEAEAAVHAMIAHDGPVYYRCGYKKEPALHGGPIDFRIGRAIQVRDGSDLTLIGTGTITYRAFEAAGILESQGVKARVLSMHTVKPLDREAVLAAARETRAVVTVEEHNVLGGLGGAVAEVLAEAGGGVPFLRVGLPDSYIHLVGSHNWLLDHYGFAPQAIAASARRLLEGRQ